MQFALFIFCFTFSSVKLDVSGKLETNLKPILWHLFHFLLYVFLCVLKYMVLFKDPEP